MKRGRSNEKSNILLLENWKSLNAKLEFKEKRLNHGNHIDIGNDFKTKDP